MAALREPQTEQPGAAGSAHVGWLKREWDAHPGRALTPLRLNAILQQAEAGNLIAQLELADDMEERDGQIYSELAKRKTAVTTLQWDVEPPDDASPEEQKTADQVRDWIKAIPCFEEDILLELMDAVLKGFKPIEMWWALDQGTLQPRFEARPQRWLCLDEDRDSLNLRDSSTPYGVPLQPYGWLLHMHRSRNGYLARAPLCRVLAWPYLFKHYAVRDLAEFLEIYGLPLRLGKYPAGASDDEKRKLLQAVVSIGHNAGGVIPQSMAIDFQAAADGTDGPFKTMWDGMDALQSKIILGQTLTSSQGQHGSQALGNVHNEVRLDILKSDAKRVAATLTSQLIAPMVLFNIAGADPRRLPRFCLDVPEPEDIQIYADALPKLAQAGLRIGVKDVHRLLRIEEAEDGEDILKGPPVPVAPGAPGQPGSVSQAGKADPPPGGKTAQPGTPAAAAAKDPTQDPAQADLAARLPAGQPPRDAIDDLVDEQVVKWRPVLAPLVSPLMTALDAAIKDGTSLADFRNQLPGLVARMDAGPAAEQLGRAAFAARLAGEADLELDPTTRGQ
jgi:phage gp29-like protein